MSLEKHKRFITMISAGLPIPSDLAAWYLDATNRHKENGEPLCICLGIRGAGIRSAKTRELLRRRDALLKFAVDHCSSEPGEPIWNKCVTLAAQINRYPRSKNENPFLKLIFDLGCNVPKSSNGIYERIVKLNECYRYSASKRRR
jgi:hypothetical protein